MAFTLTSKSKSKFVMQILEEVATITSNLVGDERFFKASMCQILENVAHQVGVQGPTRGEAEQIRSGLRISIAFGGGPESYMQSSAGSNQIFISDMVHSVFCCSQDNFGQLTFFCVHSGLMSFRDTTSETPLQNIVKRKSFDTSYSSSRKLCEKVNTKLPLDFCHCPVSHCKQQQRLRLL